MSHGDDDAGNDDACDDDGDDGDASDDDDGNDVDELIGDDDACDDDDGVDAAVQANMTGFVNRNRIVTTAGGSQVTGNGVFGGSVVGRNGNSSQNFQDLVAGNIVAVSVPCECAL